MTGLARMVGTFFYIGYMPLAPGTWGSLALVLLLYVFPLNDLYWQMVILISLILASVWSGNILEKADHKEDPRYIVIDEVAGMFLALFALPSDNFKVCLIAFILFRIFDIVKPFGINRLQDIHGGVGIVADDLAAGLLAWIITTILFTAGMI
ncbi:MAG TPA: phosphatidylglycerophosphatase A [Candidatus Marinimicrobia bacterium]|nr:phosphatidylglycerophosphatase A [Candidatus Neomarinimicrobiota bacterium]